MPGLKKSLKGDLAMRPLHDFDGYQVDASETAKYDQEHKLYYLSLGLVGEAGEFANKVKKIIRDNDGILTEEIKASLVDELGDILWYMAVFCEDVLNVPFSDVPSANIAKLRSRKERNAIHGSGDNR